MTRYPSRPLVALAGALALAAGGCDREGPETPGQCTQILLGDLVISEYMNDPAGEDGGKEWFEVYNATGKTIALKGLTISLAKVDGTSPKTHSVRDGEVPAGGYFVFGDAAEQTKPDHVDYSYGDALGAMGNSSGSIALKCGTTVVDEVSYNSAGKSGAANQFDGKLVPDGQANDQPGNWCSAVSAMAGDEKGTPGAANDPCAASANCIDPSTNQPRTAVSPGVGDLIITELMPRPAAAVSELGEYVEIYARKDVDLNGLTLSSGTSKFVLGANQCLRIPADSFAILAKSADPAANGGLPAPLATFTLTLSNTKSDVALKVGTTVVDQVWYENPAEGIATQLDPRMFDAVSNDNPVAFCAATEVFGPAANDQKGTPGLPNAECAGAADITRCSQGGVERDIVKARPGELVITEIMADPASAEATGEWFEVTSLASGPVDLNGVELSNGKSKSILAQQECLILQPGTFKVFARSANPQENGGITADLIAATFSFELDNKGGAISLSQRDAASGEMVDIDQVGYLTALVGQSTQLDPGKTDAASNDDPTAFCPGTKEYGIAGNKGTPGAANFTCPPPIDATTCKQDGVSRAAVPPLKDGLVITEIMASPKGNALMEWFEVYAVTDVDLNGLVIEHRTGTGTLSGKTTLSFEDCVTVHAGQYAVLARVTDPISNGEIPNNPIGAFPGFALGSTGSITLKHGTTEIDFALYKDAPSGKALQLDVRNLDAASNDLAEAFCPATTTYGPTANMGTPGDTNNECPPVIDPDTCTDPGETVARAVVKPGEGDLVISEVMAAPSKVSDAAGEWVEIYFKKDVDLNGVELVIGSTSPKRYPLLSTTCIKPGVGGYALVARNSTYAENGGLPTVAALFGPSLSSELSQTGALLRLSRDGVLIDSATYPAAKSGYSQQISVDKLDGLAADRTWCDAKETPVYGAGDHGTPGAANAVCVLDPNQCLDAGQLRAVVPPGEGDVIFTEVMANSSVEPAGEWIEIYVKGDFDLNGVTLTIADATVPLVSTADCVRPGAGYLVLAHSTDLFPSVFATFAKALTNSGGQVLTLARDGVTLDTHTTANVSASTHDGYSQQLSATALNGTAAERAAAWCKAETAWATGSDHGSPGAANAACVVDLCAGSTCDAQTPCNPDNGQCECTATSCTAGTCDPGTKQCVAGTPKCTDLGTGQPRDIVPPVVGDLVISEYMANPSKVDDQFGEYVEVFVKADVDLNGVELSIVGSSTYTAPLAASTDCVRPGANSYVLLARSATATANGGLPAVLATFPGPATGTFVQGGGQTLNLTLGTTTLDTVTPTKVSGTAGVSTQLKSGSLDALLNDDGANWTYTSTAKVYGDGDRGTPGAVNEE